MDLKTGSRLRSAVCSTEVVIVRAPGRPVTLFCGGVPMVAPDGPAGGDAAPAAEWASGTALGKRYAQEQLGLELLCIKAGDGTLSIDGEPLAVKGAKPLPASD